MPKEWLATLSKYSATVTREPHKATIFVAANPWQPSEPIVTWAACLIGTWVISPESFVGNRGPSLKYKAAIFTKRKVWASYTFRTDNPLHWLVMLEVLNAHPSTNQWTLLGSSAAWANARAHAERVKRPTEVLAFVGNGERLRLNMPHVFDGSSWKDFLPNIDPTRGSLGLLNM